MLFASLTALALASLPVFAAPASKCVKPAVHYEWRSLSNDDKAAFLNAVTVRSPFALDRMIRVG